LLANCTLLSITYNQPKINSTGKLVKAFYLKLIFTILIAILASGCATPKKTTSNTSVNARGYLNDYRTNQGCIDIIREFEGVRLTAYYGPGGNWLIGYGHKAGVVKGMSISQKEAERLLKADLLDFENSVNRLVTVKLNKNQFSALVCLAYNIGSGNLAASTLLRELNSADFNEAAKQFDVWRMVDGKVSPHQVKRRAAEREIFEQ
jgi:lysozyme